MMPLSPRDAQLRLPHLAPTSARRYQQHDAHRQLQLLDLAFQGHAHAAAASASAFEYDDEPLVDSMPHLSRPSSARSTRSTHSTRSARSSRRSEHADDRIERDSSSYRHTQQQQHHYDDRHLQQQHSYTTAYDDFAAQEISATGAPQDESVLVEASNPELFQAGVEEHAKRLGMDPLSDADFLWIARESLVAPLPDGWYHVTATETGAPYYYNEVTGESRWDHPCDDQFRQIFHDLKQKQQYQLSSRRYDHYSAASAATGSDDSSAHTASYYAAGSNYQTLAWQADPQHTADYGTTDELGGYDSYASSQQQQQQDWPADAALEPTPAASDASEYSDYAYKATSVRDCVSVLTSMRVYRLTTAVLGL